PGSAPDHLININGTLFFSANDGIHGVEPLLLGPVPAASSDASVGLFAAAVEGPGRAAFVTTGAINDTVSAIAAAKNRAAATQNAELMRSVITGPAAIGTAADGTVIDLRGGDPRAGADDFPALLDWGDGALSAGHRNTRRR